MQPVGTSHRTQDILMISDYFHRKSRYATYREHGTNDWLLTYTIRGCGLYRSVEGPLLAQPGDLTLLRPEVLHDYRTQPEAGRWEFLWTHFLPRTKWMDWLDWPEPVKGILQLRVTSETLQKRILDRLQEMRRYAASPSSRRQELARNALEEVLLWVDEINPRSSEAGMDERVRVVMDYVATHLAEKFGLDELAEAAGLSVSRMAHLFKAEAGMTPQQFVEQQRLSRACVLLERTDLSIKEISREVGFESPFYFSLRFKRGMKIGPREWRKGRT